MSRALLLAALSGFLLLLSCQPNTAHEVPQAVVADSRSAFSVVPDLPLWTLADGVLTAKETVTIGEKLALLGKTTKVTQGGRERELVMVRRLSGSEGWARADSVVPRSILSVVTTDDAVIYTVPHNTAATTTGIPRMTVVAVHAETGGMTFIKVTAYDTGAKLLLKGVWLRNEGVSSKPADVQAAILLQLAAASKSQKQRQAFLRTAVTDYPDSIFMPELTAAASGTPAAAAATPPRTRPTVPAAGTMASAADGVKVYDLPDETAGKTTATLAAGQKVELVEKTADDPATVDPTASWYRIRDPAGWVKGASLSPAN
jgi:hypothetical protein